MIKFTCENCESDLTEREFRENATLEKVYEFDAYIKVKCPFCDRNNYITYRIYCSTGEMHLE